jgi:hypothetical protein
MPCHREARSSGPWRSSHFDKLKVPSLSREWICFVGPPDGLSRNDTLQIRPGSSLEFQAAAQASMNSRMSFGTAGARLGTTQPKS